MSDQPRINGFAPSWSDIYVKIDDERYYGITEINYSDTRTPAPLYGMGRNHAPRGQTAGKYEVGETTMKMDKPAAKALRAAIAKRAPDGKSYGSVEFQIVVQYANGDTTDTDTLHRCRYVGTANAHAESNEALMEDITFSTLFIDRNGLTLYDATEEAP